MEEFDPVCTQALPWQNWVPQFSTFANRNAGSKYAKAKAHLFLVAEGSVHSTTTLLRDGESCRESCRSIMLFPQLLWRNERPYTHKHRSETRVVSAFKGLIFDIDKIHGPLLKFSNPVQQCLKKTESRNYFRWKKLSGNAKHMHFDHWCSIPHVVSHNYCEHKNRSIKYSTAVG